MKIIDLPRRIYMLANLQKRTRKRARKISLRQPKKMKTKRIRISKLLPTALMIVLTVTLTSLKAKMDNSMMSSTSKPT